MQFMLQVPTESRPLPEAVPWAHFFPFSDLLSSLPSPFPPEQHTLNQSFVRRFSCFWCFWGTVLRQQRVRMTSCDLAAGPRPRWSPKGHPAGPPLLFLTCPSFSPFSSNSLPWIYLFFMVRKGVIVTYKTVKKKPESKPGLCDSNFTP